MNISHAEKAIRNGNDRLNSKDCRKYITSINVTSDGELADRTRTSIDWERLRRKRNITTFTPYAPILRNMRTRMESYVTP